MPSLDFTELAIATAGPQRDLFELFARDFLEYAGFRILVGPDRGADAGRDLVVEETRTGPVGRVERGGHGRRRRLTTACSRRRLR